MPKRAVMTDQAAPPGGPYSHAVVAGDTIYLAGAIPALPDGTRVTGSFTEQAHAAFRNLAAVAEAAMRRGCVWPISPVPPAPRPRPSARQIFGNCVVLPEPVSPLTMIT